MRQSSLSCRLHLTGKRNASALLFVLLVASLLTIVVAAFLITVDNKVQRQEAGVEALQARTLSKGAVVLAMATLPDSLPVIGETVTYMDEALSEEAHVQAALTRLSQERVVIEAKAFAGGRHVAHKTKLEAVAFPARMQLADDVPAEVYVLEKGKTVKGLWQHFNQESSQVLVARSDEPIVLSEAVSVEGLHCHSAKTVVTKQTDVRNTAVFDGDLRLEAPLQASSVWLSGSLELAGAGALQAETIYVTQPLSEDVLERCSGEIREDVAQEEKMCYYFLSVT